MSTATHTRADAGPAAQGLAAQGVAAQGVAAARRGPVRQDPADRRQALYHLASPVSVLTVAHQGQLHGTTASTVTLVSREPLLVGVALRDGSSFARLAAAEGRFAVNVLRAEQADLARWFAYRGRPEGSAQFTGVDWTTDPYAHAPLLAGALAHYTCRFHGVRRTGDSEIMLGYVVRATAHDEGAPLFSYAGALFAGSLRPAPTTKETAAS